VAAAGSADRAKARRQRHLSVQAQRRAVFGIPGCARGPRRFRNLPAGLPVDAPVPLLLHAFRLAVAVPDCHQSREQLEAARAGSWLPDVGDGEEGEM